MFIISLPIRRKLYSTSMLCCFIIKVFINDCVNKKFAHYNKQTIIHNFIKAWNGNLENLLQTLIRFRERIPLCFQLVGSVSPSYGSRGRWLKFSSSPEEQWLHFWLWKFSLLYKYSLTTSLENQSQFSIDFHFEPVGLKISLQRTYSMPIGDSNLNSTLQINYLGTGRLTRCILCKLI